MPVSKPRSSDDDQTDYEALERVGVLEKSCEPLTDVFSYQDERIIGLNRDSVYIRGMPNSEMIQTIASFLPQLDRRILANLDDKFDRSLWEGTKKRIGYVLQDLVNDWAGGKKRCSETTEDLKKRKVSYKPLP